jgi:hypothetical protein
MAKLIKADGTESTVEPRRKKKFTLEELQKFVGGYIEALVIPRTPDGDLMIVNEEGKLKHLPVNVAASGLYLRDSIVGDVVILKRREM